MFDDFELIRCLYNTATEQDLLLMTKNHDMMQTYHCEQCHMDYDVEEPCPVHHFPSNTLRGSYHELTHSLKHI